MTAPTALLLGKSSTSSDSPAAIAPFAVAYFAYFIYLGVNGPWLTQYLVEVRKFTEGEAGWVISLITLSAVTSSLIFGRRADRLGSRRRLQRQISLWFACWAAAWLAEPGPALALLIAGLIGLGQGPQVVFLDSSTVDGLGPNRHRWGQVRVVGSLAWGIAALVIGAVREQGVPLDAIPWVLFGSALFFHLTTWRLPDTQARRSESKPLALWDVLRIAPLPVLLVACVLHGAAFANYDAFSAHTLRSLGLSPLESGGVLLIGIISESLLFWNAPRLLKRFSVLTLCLWSLGVSAFRWAVLPYVHDAPIFAALQTLHAFSFGLWYMCVLHTLSLSVPAELRTSGQVLMSVTLTGGIACGAAAGGLLREHHGIATAFALAAIVEVITMGILLLGFRGFARPVEEAAQPGECSGSSSTGC